LAKGRFVKRQHRASQIVLSEVIDAPFSQFAEALRSVKLAVNLNGDSGKVVGFTSSLPNEGKSTIAGALAQLTAQGGGKVVLVDCDLRNPTLSRTLAPNATAGIFDVLQNIKPLEEVIFRDPSTGLWFSARSEHDVLLRHERPARIRVDKKLFARFGAAL